MQRFNGGRKLTPGLLKQFGRHISQRADGRVCLGEKSNCLLTFFAPLVVSTGREIVLDHGVADHELNPAGEWSELKFERAAIQQQRVPGLAHARYELIHNADSGAHKFVLGLAAKFCDLRQGQLLAIQTHEGKSRSDLNGSR